MLDIQSNDKSRSGYLIITSAIVILMLLGAYMYSLFAKPFDVTDFTMDSELTVAAVAEPTPAPPEPERVRPREAQKAPNVDVRRELVQNIESTPVKPPEVARTTPSTVPTMREGVETRLGNINLDAVNPLPSGYRGEVNTKGTGNNEGTRGSLEGTGDKPAEVKTTPPPPRVEPKPEPPKTISGGVLNGKAISLPQPAYPQAAKAVRASGVVRVNITIDERGNVISASAGSGHPLLKPTAVAAARRAKFSPTTLSGKPVKVTGYITYNFTL